ncbi:MAG: 3'(2'),5'-bisphosphate nucleotidase CysQ [Thiotrichaceae bacterium]|nr:3'(2'),5'-bisphosphate nucleotidase CysQ [Thiotrichaceae bacterium]
MNKTLFTDIEKIAQQAGKIIMQIYQQGFSVQIKSDDSPVTEADLKANDFIITALEKLSDYPILSEELALADYETRRRWDTYWLIDPLDGTKSFVNRTDEFTVNIALICHHKPVLGVVYVPTTGQSYCAQEGIGAFQRSESGRLAAIQCRPVHSVPSILGSFTAGKRLEAFLQGVGEHHYQGMHSSLKICLVAAGEADVYPRLWPTSEWDTAAAHAILNEAGGRLVTIDNETLAYNKKESLLNPEFLAYGDAAVNWCGFVPPK